MNIGLKANRGLLFFRQFYICTFLYFLLDLSLIVVVSRVEMSHFQPKISIFNSWYENILTLFGIFFILFVIRITRRQFLRSSKVVIYYLIFKNATLRYR